MHVIATHPTYVARFTPHSAAICQALNAYKRANPGCTFSQMTAYYNATCGKTLSVTSIRRYYYGAYGFNGGITKGNRYVVREGAKVTI